VDAQRVPSANSLRMTSEKNCREMYEQMVRIAIVPSWARFYDFGAGRMPKFLKELAERKQS